VPQSGFKILTLQDHLWRNAESNLKDVSNFVESVEGHTEVGCVRTLSPFALSLELRLQLNKRQLLMFAHIRNVCGIEATAELFTEISGTVYTNDIAGNS
jgi:hypothetical protein